MICYTRSLTSTEQQYNIYNKELLAIVHALQHWRVELQEVKHKALVKTDHHNLQYFMSTKELSLRQAK
jgi:hypothetical protein